MPVDEWIQGAGVAFAAAVALITAVRQYRAEKHRNRLEEWTGRESIIDARINAHLERLDEEVRELRERNQELEEKVQILAEQLAAAVKYIRENDLDWPPPRIPGTGPVS
jgi:predicted nuclease with TOPRIM domain